MTGREWGRGVTTGEEHGAEISAVVDRCQAEAPHRDLA